MRRRALPTGGKKFKAFAILRATFCNEMQSGINGTKLVAIRNMDLYAAAFQPTMFLVARHKSMGAKNDTGQIKPIQRLRQRVTIQPRRANDFKW